MSLTEIQSAVDKLPAAERTRLTACLVSRYPLLQVKQLLARAKKLVEQGEWQPTPPTSDNEPSGKILDHAARTIRELGLDR